MLISRDTDGVQLRDLVTNCEADRDETITILKSNGRFHCLAVYHAARLEWEEALSIWDRLVKKSIEDTHFPGCSYVADQLTKYSNQFHKFECDNNFSLLQNR